MENSNPFSICFNMLKLKYSVYDESISSLNVLQPTDKVNVFLNIETILNYLSTIKDLEQKLVLNPSFRVDMVADLINVAAHYKEFFKNNGLDTKVFLYMTDLTSEIESFHESKYNIDYRCYYLNKYNGNPKFALLTEGFVSDILPMAQNICDFIPDVYLIRSKNIEGSLIPFIVSEKYPDRKNFIVSGDMYETQYEFLPNFTHHLFKRHFGNSNLSVSVPQYIRALTKRDELNANEKEIFSHYGFYTLLLSCIGERYRSIDSINGIGVMTLGKLIQNQLNQLKISKDTENVNMLSTMFDDAFTKECVEENYQAINLKHSTSLLLEGEKKSILSQIEDRIDLNSLMKLNQTVFHSKEHELRIESLLK